MIQHFPKIRVISQDIDAPFIPDVKAYFLEKVAQYDLSSRISAGDTVALTGSSRGIKDQALILRTLVDHVKKLKATPFIIPAMGSHGKATSEGQLRILRDYGITEESMGCKIKATMDVVEIAQTEFEMPVYIDKFAAKADKIIIVNKIKSHSKFIGDVESGITKMCVMGLGKQKGAKLYHRIIEEHSWQLVVSSLRKTILQKMPIICGIGIIQNIYGQTAEIHLLNPKDFEKKEPSLLKRYKQLSERMPFKHIDLMIVDEMGKNIFGTGMDTNITGRKSTSKIKVKWLFVRDLTLQTHGNAQGIGLADFTTKRVIDKVDFNQTYMNALTAHRTDSPKLPIYLKNDKKVLNTIADLTGKENLQDLRLVWIRNTLSLNKLIISEALFNQVEEMQDIRFFSKPEHLQFDEEGFLNNSLKYWDKNKEE